MDRRGFLRTLGAVAGSAVAGAIAAGCATPSATARATSPRRRPPTPSKPQVTEVDGLPVSEWLVEENRRAGTVRWATHPRASQGGALPAWPAPIEGFTDRVSYAEGEEVSLFINTAAASFRAEIYRMGYYQGLGARLVDTTSELAGRVQPPPRFTPGLNMVECDWQRSTSLTVGRDWLPGTYLVKLVGSGGEQQYIPFTVRDDSSRAAIVVQNGVTTWQAYNLYGGYSLYGGGSTGALAERSRVVSFDRPYRNSNEGAGNFIGTEFPFVYLAERLGLDVTYWTDLDLHLRPELLANHRCLVSLGHDEYWSWQMRFNGVEDHLARGLNVAVLGANACYRQIRFEDSAHGANRRVVCYKDATADPIYTIDRRLATGGSWATDPVPFPESELFGVMYQSYGASAPFVVADSSSFIYAGTGLHDGDVIRGARKGLQVVGSEFDGFEPALPGPDNVEILAHSPTSSVSGDLHADASYYTRPSGGGGVFATGTASWVTLLWDGRRVLDNHLGFGISPAVVPLTKMTLNVLASFARGPASLEHPSHANWQRFYSPRTAAVASADVP